MFGVDRRGELPFSSAAKPSNLKTNNRKAILDLLRKHDKLSVTDISSMAGLSRTTAMKTLNFLLSKGYVVSIGKGASTFEGGKRPEIFKFSSDFGYVYCVSLLPTCIEGAILDLNANIIDRCKIGHGVEAEVEAIVANIALAFRLLCEKNDIEAGQIITVAVGCDGIVDSDNGIISNSPHFKTWQKNVNISRLISEALGGDFDVIADNNVRFMAHSDLHKLSSEQCRDVVALMAQYGVGGCVLHNWQVIRGANYELGEFGHQIVNWSDDEICECGGRGCFEKMIIEERVLRQAAKMFAQDPKWGGSVLAPAIMEQSLKMQDIFDASNSDDAFAQSVMDWVLHWFSIELHNILLSHDPQVVIIYGTYTTAGEYFFSNLRRMVNELHFRGKGAQVDIICTEYDTGTAFIVGAAKYAIERFFDSPDTYSDISSENE